MTDAAQTAVVRAMRDAKAILERDLGDLPQLLAKLLRAGIDTGPSAPMVSGWCAENAAAAARVVGAMAMIAAAQLNAGRNVG